MRCASAACVIPPNAVSKPIGHAKFPSRSSAVIAFMMPLPLHPSGWCGFFGAASLRISRQIIMHNNEPTNAEIRSSKVILISPRPKSMWSSRNMSPPTNAPSIPTPMLVQTPKPRLLKVMRRPASVPASAPMISQTMILPMEIDIIQSFLLGAFLNAARCQLYRKRCYALLCLRLRTLFLHVVLGHFPGFVGIVAVHGLEDLQRVWPQIFLIDDTAGTNDKGLHAGDAILRGRRSQCKPANHCSFDDKVHLSKGRVGSLPFQNLEIVAMVRLRLTGIRITLLKSFGHSFPNWPLP